MALTAQQIITSFDAAGITDPAQLTAILTKLRLGDDKATLGRQRSNLREKIAGAEADLSAREQAIEEQLRDLAGEPGGK